MKYDIQQLLLSCGAIAGPFFIVVFLIEGALRNRYDPFREAVSALAIGPRGWVQQANFIVTGALTFAYALGLSSALRAYGGSFWAPVLVGIYAIGLIGAGIFVTDRPGLRDRSAERRKRHVRGILHDVCSLFGFIPLFIAFFVLHQLFAAAGAYCWAVYSGASAVLFGVGFILFVRGFASTGRLASIRGLFQRITELSDATGRQLSRVHQTCFPGAGMDAPPPPVYKSAQKVLFIEIFASFQTV